MKPRPIPVTILSLLMLATGAAGFTFHAYSARPWHRFPADMVLACLVSLIAVVCGIFMLRGSNWARWLTLAWIAFHVAISALQSVQQTVVHGLLLLLFAYLLFRPAARAFFSARL
ncbi:MAG TPA: hypothetical protein VHX20_11565 [Terracidiphilus sp.]|jgi:hypothetical protein|nr:hypothetical protein [Terracidiphilus sp.]